MALTAPDLSPPSIQNPSEQRPKNVCRIVVNLPAVQIRKCRVNIHRRSVISENWNWCSPPIPLLCIRVVCGVDFRMKWFLLAVLLAVVVTGCVTPPINWQARIGVYTFDQAVTNYGPPDKSARLSDGTTVNEWMTRRGEVIYSPGPYFYGPGYYYAPVPVYNQAYFPPVFLRLTFGPDGRLQAAKTFSR